MIKGLRVDHRLVHGQVAFTWTHFYAATRIIVIDDKSATDEFQKMALNMAKPAGCKLNIFTVEKALSKMPKVETLNDSVSLYLDVHMMLLVLLKVIQKLKNSIMVGFPKRKDRNNLVRWYI